MPNEDIEFMPTSNLMSVAEIEKLAKIFVELGIKKIRLTGGEPLVRKDFTEIIEKLSCLPIELTLTSNGILIHKHIETLQKANVKTLNISLDSLKPEVFFAITRRNAFEQVWNNILLLLENGFRLKINVVALNNIVENELLDFVALTKNLPLHIRFIEWMPFKGNQWSSRKVVTALQMLQMIQQEYDFIKLKDAPNETAKKYQVIGYQGTFAFITTMSEHFCGNCNRLRLTADGKIKNCLFGKDELDLLSPLRLSTPILDIIEKSIQQKHAFLGGQLQSNYQKNTPENIENRSMIAIGG